MKNYQNKKIAVVLTGHLRTYKNVFFNLRKNLLDLYDCDIYISTWNDVDHLQNKFYDNNLTQHLNFFYSSWIKKIVINDSKDFFKKNNSFLLSYPCEFGSWRGDEYKLYRDGLLTHDAINKLTSQWYAVSEGFKLIKTPNDYDYLIKTRFDVDFLRPFNFLDNDIVTGNSYGYEEYYNIRDYIVYIKPSAYDIMKNMYSISTENFKKYRNFSAETMLEYSLKNNSLKLPFVIDDNLRCDIDYRILK